MDYDERQSEARSHDKNLAKCPAISAKEAKN
jgi:hypothetical protein